MNRVRIRLVPLLLLVTAGWPLGSSLADEPEPSFDRAATSAAQDLQQSLGELAALRERIAAEKLPLTRRLNEVQSRLAGLRAEHEDLTRQLDSLSLEFDGLQQQVEGRRNEKDYLANNLDEYVRNLETRVHISELQRYGPAIEQARLAVDDSELSAREVLARQAAVIDLSLDRLLGLVGGERFDGHAVDSSGTLRDVTFALIGPIALYSTADGSQAGVAEQKLNSLEPNLEPIEDPQLAAGIASLVASGSGSMAFDPTLGNASKVEETRETLWEHIQAGGPVMWPILALAATALMVALIKWVQLTRVRRPKESKVQALLEAVRRDDRVAATKAAEGLKGPAGEMLRTGVQNLDEPKALIEELMFETMLETRLRLQRFLSFVALAAAAAPLLGLLGTVTGIIGTFRLITLFGTGDAKTLSSGISEALITTKFGLIVAIPALLLHAYLSRKSRRFIDAMEKSAVQFLNRIPGRGRASRPIEDSADRPAAGLGAAPGMLARSEAAEH